MVVKTIRSSLLGARGCGILQGCHCRLVPQEIGDQIRWSTGGFTSIHQLNLLWNHINFIDFAWFCCWGLDFLWSAVISQSIWPPGWSCPAHRRTLLTKESLSQHSPNATTFVLIHKRGGRVSAISVGHLVMSTIPSHKLVVNHSIS